MQYEIRHYKPGDETELLKTFNAVFAAHHPDYVPRTMEQWQWEFRDNPAGNQIVLAVTEEGRVICQYCCLPFFVNLRGEKVRAGLGVDTFLDPEYSQGLKREGVFLRVARTYFKDFAVPEINAFGYGYPNEKAYRVSVKMLHYIEIKKPQSTVFRNLWEVDNDEDVGGASTAGTLIEEVKDFDERFDDFWLEMMPHYPMTRWRDTEFLNWRYRGCHWVPYRIFAALDGTGALKGYCITRAGWQNHPILAVPEIFTHPDDDGTFADMLRFVTQIAREQEQLRVEAWLAESSRAFSMATSMGFRAEPSPFNLVGRFYRDDLDRDYLEKNWYYTLGDLDIL